MSSVKSKFLQGAVWMVLGRGSSSVVSLIIFIILARLLGPYDFGLVAFATVAVDLTKTISSAGIPDTLIRETVWDQARASTAFWTNIAISLAMTIIVALAIAPVAGALYDPAISLILVALSITFVIDGACAIHESKVRREFGYKALAARQVSAALVGGVVGVALAFVGIGYWALVISRILNSLIQTVLTWRAARFTPSLSVQWGVSWQLLGLGLPLAGARILSQLGSRTTDLIVGTFLGPSAIGLYRVGTRAVSTMHSVLVQPLNQPALSAFARVADNGPIDGAFLRVTNAAALITYPIYFGVAAISHDFVPAVFGEQWAGSSDVMMFAAMSGAMATVLYFLVPVLTAAGRGDLAFQSNVVALLAVIVSALIALPFGLSVVAGAYCLQMYLTLPIQLHFLRKGIGLSWQTLIAGHASPIVGALVMFAILKYLRLTWLVGLTHWQSMVTLAAIGVVVYTTFVFTTGRRQVANTINELRPLLKTRKTE